jgi:thymidylate synthase
MSNHNCIEDVRNDFLLKYLKREFIKDKTGINCIELIGMQFIANEDFIFGKPNEDYIKRELNWYESKSLNVYDIEAPVPEIWTRVCDKDGKINSNYGWCIWSHENFEQYKSVLLELQNNPHSRRAQMIYTRPSMWRDYNANGMSDFICTTAVQYFIRNNKLISYVTMRSNDAFHGYRNDVAWQKYIQSMLAKELNVEAGDMIWNVGSLHLYESQFYLVDYFKQTGKTYIKRSEYAKQYEGLVITNYE